MVEDIYFYIRQDLILHQGDLLNLQNYYTHKYRSKDVRLDINVGIFLNDNQEDVVQIYVADKFTKIREQLILKNNKIIDSILTLKRFTHEQEDRERD